MTAGLANLFFCGSDLLSASGHYIYRVTRQSALWKGSDVHALFGKALQRLHNPPPIFGHIKRRAELHCCDFDLYRSGLRQHRGDHQERQQKYEQEISSHGPSRQEEAPTRFFIATF